MSSVRISGAVVAQDNADTIGAVLASLAPLVDEIVFVDGGSTDATPEIAVTCDKLRLYRRPFDGNIGAQKNFAFDQCLGEWILVLDSDEVIGGIGVGRLRKLTYLPFLHWYSIPRYWLVERDGELHYLTQKPYYRDRQRRLFRNEPCHRYDVQRSPIHHEFAGAHLAGRALRRPHIFHYTFLLQDRAEREAKVQRYLAREPRTAHLHRMYLWEDSGVPTAPLPEPAPSILRAPHPTVPRA
jgi:glycosyltransferase involved in cell wall biosynthesis